MTGAEPTGAEPTGAELVAAAIGWYDRHRRDLPWRRPGTTPWGVLTSEVMLQQTPVSRVVPAWTAWLARWPTPAALAAEPAGEAVRRWGRLGYPRRALNLHRSAQTLVADHGGAVPDDEAALLALPGVGAYTAAAVRAFAFGRRSVVLDTNVRRLLTRAVGGAQRPGPVLTAGERERADALLPPEDAVAAAWSAAAMELGALVCTAADPACPACPLAAGCAWRAAGYPAASGPAPRAQGYAGTDRQVRGLLLAALRADPRPVPRSSLEAVWTDPAQRERALASLVADGLVEPLPSGRFRLPGATHRTGGRSRPGAAHRPGPGQVHPQPRPRQ